MPPIAYLLILVGAVTLRQVMVGRAKEIPSDARDLTLALFSGDTTEVGAVLGRRGENVPESELGSGSGSGTTILGSAVGTASGIGFATAVKDRGQAASNGYVLGATGPNSYDCSGLIWRTMMDTGIYDGPRFTTSTFEHVASGKGWKRVSSPVIGCVILWPNKHMGVSFGGDTMYSARSPSKGIGTSSVSGDSSYFGFSPVFYQVVGL